MSTVTIFDKAYEVANQDELKKVVTGIFTYDYFRTATEEDIAKLPQYILRDNLVKSILASGGDDVFKMKIETYIASEAKKYSLQSSMRMYIVYACVSNLLKAKLSQDTEMINKLSMYLCILTNIGTTII